MQVCNKDGKQYVLCAWRRRYVRLTPEEHIRQLMLHALVEQLNYPHNLIGVEVSITVAGKSKRCDAIVYDRHMHPLMLIEFKAPIVQLTQEVFDQAAIYNRTLNVPYMLLSNGEHVYVAKVHENKYDFLDHIPNYEQLVIDK
jgi:hypothetical protein